ncbi:MAG: hypothetical protein ABL967_12320 [Bryobacteraceae bacterium]
MMTSPSISNAVPLSGTKYSHFQVSLLNLAFQGDLAPSVALELETNGVKEEELASHRT